MWIRNTDRNESTNGPTSKLMIETKPKRFDVFQNLKWNVSIYSKNFGTKQKLFDVFQLFFLLKQNVSMYFQIFGTKPKLFEVCNFFLQKQNVSIQAKNFGTKPKLFDVFQLFFSKSKSLLFNPKILRSERERFGLIMNFVSKMNIYI